MPHNNKFIMVLAILDEDTQQRISELYSLLVHQGMIGTQSQQLPYHISLGSYTTDKVELISKAVCDCASNNSAFGIDIVGIGNFDNKVLFLQPDPSVRLTYLHSVFDSNVENSFDWHAHITVIIDQRDNIDQSKIMLDTNFSPFSAKVTGLALYEFFPPRKVLEADFN